MDAAGALTVKFFRSEEESISIGGSVNDGSLQVSKLIFADDTELSLAGGLRIEGSDQADELYGTAQNDTLVGLAGDDTLYGGAGDDVYEYSSGDGHDTIQASSTDANALKLTDAFQHEIRLVTDATGSLTVKFFRSEEESISIGGSVNDGSLQVSKLIFADDTELSLAGGLRIEGSDQADELYGTAQNDTLVGLAGDDTLYGGAGDDVYEYSSGDGHDTIQDSSTDANALKLTDAFQHEIRLVIDATGSLTVKFFRSEEESISIGGNINDGSLQVAKLIFADDSELLLSGGLFIEGSDQADDLYGTIEDDTIIGWDGNDSLYGERGNDVLDGGDGIDTLVGGLGDDTYVHHAFYGDDVIDNTDALDGLDTLSLGGGIDPAGTTLSKAGDDLLIDTGYEVITIINQFKDLGTDDNSLYSIDIISFSDYQVSWDKQFIADTVGIALNDAPIISAAGDSTFILGSAPIAIGNGVIVTDTDDTELESATVSITAGFVSTEDLMSFVDTASIVGSYDSDAGILSLSGTATVEEYQTALASITYNNTNSNDPDLNSRIISWSVNDGDDSSTVVSSTLTLESAALNTILGGSANDVINGTLGNDYIDGGAGHDTLTGSGGNDTIVGGTGNDTLRGGEGDDTFVFQLASGQDSVNDFDTGQDVIDISGWSISDTSNDGIINDLSLTENNNGVVIEFDGNNTVTLVGVSIVDLVESNFIF